MRDKVSIIIPAYNAENTVSKTIEACLNQELAGEVEVIVIDDGSTDSTADIIRRYRVRYLRQENSGPARARNAGWRAADGRIICFTDADCIPAKDWVAKLTAHYSGDDVGAVGGSYSIANRQSIFADCIHKEIIYRHARMPRYVKALGSYNLSVRKDVLEEAGGFDETYTMASGEDNDLCYKITKKGYSLVFDKEAKVSHYHPEKLLKYLKSQFWHGFWRVRLYVRHRDMAKGDDYSGLWDYAQPAVALAIIFLAPFVFSAAARALICAFLAIEALMQLPVPLSICMKTKSARYILLAPVTFLRAFSRGSGMFFGVIKFMAMRG
ncbi:MAG: glycosyltransferase [Candidatus Omnitrophica bacterium]|nr:glycosyltransferase [Candidatus Omnitrophota bacterium]